MNLQMINKNIEIASRKFGIDPNLIRAVMKQESNFNHNFALRCPGLMQLIHGTADWIGVTDPFDISQNIEGG